MMRSKCNNKSGSISAIIIAKNEEKKIGDCLESVRWADEIVLVDTGSTDKTKQIAKRYEAKIIDYKKGSYSNWRNEGLSEARGEWVFYIDADERMDKDLRKQILTVVAKPEFGAYLVPRKNVFFGKVLMHGGWYPDYVKRLFNKSELKGWEGEVHEEPMFDGEYGKLSEPLRHYTQNNLSEMVDKTNLWSDIEARLMYNANHPKMNILRFFSAMFREFWYRMVIKMAFLDGTIGIIVGLYQIYSKFISYAKLWEMQLRTTQNDK